MKKSIFKRISVIAGSISAGIITAASNASALDWTGVTLATSDVDSIMALVITGLATLWGYRKVVKTMNRS